MRKAQRITLSDKLMWKQDQLEYTENFFTNMTQLGKKGAADLFKLELHGLGILLSDHLGNLFSDIEGFILNKRHKKN
jgi:hypothetical protein